MNKTLLKNILLIFKLTSLTVATIGAFVFLFSGIEGFLIATFVIYAISFASFAVSEGFELSDLIKARAIEKQNQHLSKADENDSDKQAKEQNRDVKTAKLATTRGMLAVSIVKLCLSLLIMAFSIVSLILY